MTDIQNCLDILAPNGLIAKRLTHYEARPEQIEMAQAVQAAIEHKEHLAVEAGTGVGKSFAYLVPSILYCVADQNQEMMEEANGNPSPSCPETKHDSSQPDFDHGIPFNEEDSADNQLGRVVISTHTISLQEQLFEKDIPFLRSILPFEFTAVLVKGRSNYLCLRRLTRVLKKADSLIEDEYSSELNRIKEWTESTGDGSLSDLQRQPKQEIWSEICCESDNCMGRACPYRNQCFYWKARRRIDNAQILVVNHALLFSDLALARGDGSILPLYKILVIDEAHTMEQVATDHLGVTISQGQIDYLLNRLYNERNNKGLLTGKDNKYKQAAEKVLECRYRAEELFQDLADWLAQIPGGNGRVLQPNIVKNGLGESLKSLLRELRIVVSQMEDQGERQELISAVHKIETHILNLEIWLGQKDPGYVYWLDKKNYRGVARVNMEAAPIDVGPILRERLFGKTDSVIMTSATLSIQGLARQKQTQEETDQAFAFFRSRIGLTQVQSLQTGSPFNYRNQLTLVLLKNIPEPDDYSDRYYRVFREKLKDYIMESKGGVFVLFTNYSLLRKTANDLLPWLAEKNLPFFSQGDGLPRTKMIEEFKKRQDCVLFGTDSFWQGVDIPGNALRNVIITKLPFFVPDQPLIQARLEVIADRGGNPFHDFLLPHAILKFKQGFGRLIRTKTDSGIVVVMDARIHLKSYGRLFLESLPDCRLRIDSYNS